MYRTKFQSVPNTTKPDHSVQQRLLLYLTQYNRGYCYISLSATEITAIRHSAQQRLLLYLTQCNRGHSHISLSATGLSHQRAATSCGALRGRIYLHHGVLLPERESGYFCISACPICRNRCSAPPSCCCCHSPIGCFSVTLLVSVSVVHSHLPQSQPLSSHPCSPSSTAAAADPCHSTSCSPSPMHWANSSF